MTSHILPIKQSITMKKTHVMLLEKSPLKSESVWFEYVSANKCQLWGSVNLIITKKLFLVFYKPGCFDSQEQSRMRSRVLELSRATFLKCPDNCTDRHRDILGQGF